MNLKLRERNLSHVFYNRYSTTEVGLTTFMTVHEDTTINTEFPDRIGVLVWWYTSG